MSHWRQVSRERIQEVIDRVGWEDRELLKQELFRSYPFGMRNYTP